MFLALLCLVFIGFIITICQTHSVERQTVQLPTIIPSRALQSHIGSLHVNESSMHQPNLEVNQSLPYNSKYRPPIIPSRFLYSQTGSLHVNRPPLPQPSLEVNRSQPCNIESQTQYN
ncbi:hypothetical protein H5410_045808 [Solanum commersonii]|uniref:Uncharacterized protein n=1 Tax=Solanum commersonii TaxID=4109 RepID=A0A9J5XDT9_SOLCO|nr:hypothetical protein H5410_045808 [Solanum commersonii]